MNLAVEHGLGGGRGADFFLGEDCYQAVLQGSKAAFDLAFGLRAWGDQVSYPQGRKGALELGTGIPVIGHGIMAKEAQSVGIDDHGESVLDKEAAKMLEMIPSSVGGDKDGA